MEGGNESECGITHFASLNTVPACHRILLTASCSLFCILLNSDRMISEGVEYNV